MRRGLLIAVLTMSLPAIVSAGAGEEDFILVPMGTSVVVEPEREVARVAVSGGDAIAFFIPLGGKRLRLSTLQAGRTCKFIWSTDGSRQTYCFEVFDSHLLQHQPEVGRPDPEPTVWTEPRYGGRRMEKVDCGLPQGRSLALLDEGLSRAEKGDHRGAIGPLEAASRRSPTPARALVHLGAEQAATGQRAAALRSYETYVLSCPGDLTARALRKLLAAERPADGVPAPKDGSPSPEGT